MIVNAKDLILGRVASFAAKQALLGEKVDIINCENAIITGNRKQILGKYKKKMKMGSIRKGPFFPKRADRLVKRTIRGMLPYKKENGKKAFKRIGCYIGVPDNLKNKKTEELKKMHISKLTTLRYVKVSDVCRQLGSKY